MIPRLLGLLSLLACVGMVAEEPEGAYVRVYNLVQQGDELMNSGRVTNAREKFSEARDILDELSRRHPTWNTQVVQYRLKYLRTKLDTPLESIATASPRSNPPSVRPPRGEASALTLLQAENHQLKADQELLKARLAEALSAQPASVDPEEKRKAEERIVALQKEVDILKVRLHQAESSPQKGVSPLVFEEMQKELNESRVALSQKEDAIARLRLEAQAMARRLDSVSGGNASPDARIAVTDKALDTGDARVAEYRAQSETLLAEKRILESRMAELELQHHSKTEAIRASLSGELAEARRALEGSAAEIARLESRIVAAEQARDDAHRRLSETEGMLAKSQAAERLIRAELGQQVDEGRRLELERDELRVALNVKTRELAQTERKFRMQEAMPTGEPAADLSVAVVRVDRPAVSQPQAKTTRGAPSAVPGASGRVDRFENERMSRPRLPGLAKARSAAPRDTAHLAHLAAVQMDQGRLDEAAVTLKGALGADPDHGMSLVLQGRLFAARGEFDRALDPLSRAAQLDPDNAEVHNYLGLVLMKKGASEPAEQVLKRAIRLSPDYGEAHYHLALVYASARPAHREAMREHYMKAISLGQPTNPELEAALVQAGAAQR